MTKDEIKKALTCCSNPSISYCKDCPYANYGEFDCCNGKMCKAALNLINEQETEIEQLKAENEKMRKERGYINQLKEELLLKHYHVDCYQEEIKKQAKIDVLNKAKERIKTAIDTYFNLDGGGYYLAEGAIDDIDGLIEEVESGRYDKRFTPNNDTLEIILVKDLQEVEK